MLDENTGIVVDKNDIDAFEKAIIEACCGKLTAEACIEKSKCFDKNERFKEYIKLY